MYDFLLIFFGTFLLEDLALATSLAWVNNNRMPLSVGFLACFLGISIGDLVLYGIGRTLALASHLESFPRLSRWLVELQKKGVKNHAIPYAIFFSRFAPGTRLPTYVFSGYLNYSLSKFILLTIISVFAWVCFAFIFGLSFLKIFTDNWIVSILALLVFFKLSQIFVSQLADDWDRKALAQFWRKYLHFEFWPSLLFYIPIGVQYVLLSVRYLSPLKPFYANPMIKNGGLLEESKWDLLKNLDQKSPFTLKTKKLSSNTSVTEIECILQEWQINYPVILKPDIGQRGFGVRIIRNKEDLKEYLAVADFDLVLQEYCSWQHEAGLFYVKLPLENQSFIYSVTDKYFPFVTGDGVTKLGDLILKDSRAKIIAQTYFNRHRKDLNRVIDKGHNFWISECGNHCQGAIFKDGHHLITDKLKESIEVILKDVPHFYFGRIDVRYQDQETLKNGLGLKVLEINGAGAEATHIWDPNTTLAEAYRVLFRQWALLFRIGHQIQKKGLVQQKIYLFSFLFHCFKVYFRKAPLSTSS